MDVDNLIFDINSNNLIKSKKFSERQIRGLIFYLRSMILIIPSLFFCELCMYFNILKYIVIYTVI